MMQGVTPKGGGTLHQMVQKNHGGRESWILLVQKPIVGLKGAYGSGFCELIVLMIS